ncbi:MAG: PAS domain S-box protein [Microcoleus sp. PH2017_10_PVI_O_A]|uniref:PAS domain S-box protein n=1 Tax=unclassified Microcoleus TaxID=2642155 RepID=UPI001D48C7B9|nr:MULTISPECIES: PAS domain S-box protein [unclassified Microcoleus]TAE77391.1 MAG: PAS domain S-box protein [Oscillatoriales cyanobacterium]MCC3408721.1 PAS domain S-box protein [Microcoleus sp. PH2017_10_PVI_O_A]MCC3462808.1 PAS domain S-box protein [Microcoleus sp. PH2017_11_PCY_U_A]MCC3481291.1 PAS domain S-box protein [Microcoleus sp. PH2017_12_PCY_D_A]MCC3529514.1 PAS domain S-box protein [Microcoleus sp. PH2017_21_RUC_O_A]
MVLTSDTGADNNSDCELIYDPASIQPHGILLVLESPVLKILQVSNNTFEAIGIYPKELVGHFLHEFVELDEIDAVEKALVENDHQRNYISLSFTGQNRKSFFQGRLHQSSSLLIVELEQVVAPKAGNCFNSYHLVQEPIDKIHNTPNLQVLCQTVVEEVRRTIGFDRAIVYQFDATGAGEVIAEDKAENLASLLGMHYPAADIPPQARKLFSMNLIRFIPDLHYQPVELIPDCNPLTGIPLDLGFSWLRTVSPCHLQYLKNMKIGASMTVTLIKDRKLWGLIACHHQTPKYVNYETRTACELIAKFVNLELSYKQDSEDRDYAISLKEICHKFITEISQENCFVEGLLKSRDELLALVGATGGVVCANENLIAIGKTPELAEIKNLIAWIKTQINKNDVFHTDCLSKLYRPSAKFKEVASGLLVLAMSEMQNYYILWFRPEAIQTVNWAGKPDWPIEFKPDGTPVMSPRTSFELWQETVRLKSLPWQGCEIEIARELRVAIASIELRKINQQLKLALSATKIGFWDWDVQKNRIVWSREHEELFGLAPGTFDGTYQSFAACIHPEDLKALESARNQALAQRGDFCHEHRVIWPDGSIHWMEGKGKFFYSETGEAVRMVGTVREISDRKARELQLRLLELVVTTTNDAVLITEAEPIDEPGPRILYVNPAFTRMSGYTLEEVLGKTPRILQGEKTDRANLDRIRRALETWQPVRVDLINYRKDGTEFWVELSIVPIADETGWFSHWVAVQRDISDRKQAEAALQQLNELLEMRVLQRTRELEISQTELRQSEALFRSLSESSPVGIFKIDAEGKCTYTNPRCQAIGGFTAAEALGDGWMQFVHPEDLKLIESKWSESRSVDGEFSCEFRHIQPDGTIRFGRAKTAPIFSDRGQLIGYVGTVIDITESRAIEKMKNEFISIVSHELRTPLTSIRGSLGLLAAGVLKDRPETAKQMLDIASSDTERLVRLVNDILDLERLESSQVTIVKQWCDTQVLMRKSAEAVMSLAAENHIDLSVLPAPAQIWADPDRIVQMLVNLLSNAIKFSPPGCIVTVRVEDLGARVLFEVKDRGRGIPADKLETIFGRFQQVDASDSRQKGGTGLGLAICRSIVQQHGGRIWAESVVSEGTSFYFTVPAPLDGEGG